MKNFTPFGRLLLLAVFLLPAVGLSAQQSCNLDPSLIEISIKNTCNDGGATDQPYVTIDFGSTAVDGMTEITIESIFLGNINLGTYTITVPVFFGFTTFELPGFALPTSNNFVRLNEVEDLESGCVQTFGAGQVQSGFYSLTTPAAITITKDNTRSIDPPCGDIPTGKLSIRVSPTDGMFPNNRFNTNPQDVRLVPSNFATFISVIPPGSSPNPPNSGYYLIESNQSLVSGNYTFLIFDNVTGCEVAFETVVGDPANDFDVVGQPRSVTCFGDTDGRITIMPQNADPAINGLLNYSLNGPNGIQRTGSISASNGVYNMPTENNLVAGQYILFLNASNGGCMGRDTVVIDSPAEIIVNDLAASTICADEANILLTASSITGIDGNATFRLIDGSQFDPLVGNNSCWDRSPAPLAGGLQNDGSYEFSIGAASVGFCRAIDRDTVITVFMEIETQSATRPSFDCRELFQFDVRIDAQPATPTVSLSANNQVGNPVGPNYCSNQDVAISIGNYVAPGFTYDISYTPVAGVTGVDDFANDEFTYTGPGSVIGSFTNTTNSLQTINFTAVATNDATNCESEVATFSIPVRPLPVVDPIFPNTAIVCSREPYTSPAITLNGNGGNANVRFNYAWNLSPGLTFLSDPGTSISGAGLASGATVNGRFRNVTGVAQTATLTIFPTFPQTGNDCQGQPRTVTVTVAPRPSLNYDLTIGDLDTMLTSPNVASFEICNGEDFFLDNLSIPQDYPGDKLKYVRYRVRGDARFLQIRPNGAPGTFGPNDIQTTQFVPIANFAIGQPNIQNNNPDNNAQVAQITLTPYYERQGTPTNSTDICAGQPIRLFLTLNPTPPALPSPQAATVCSDERIEYTIMGASGMGATLETRITETNVFPGMTNGMFVVPAGADRIENFRFELTGGNGGGTTTTGGVGGFGASVNGSLDEMELIAGDTIRVRKGLAGTANNRNGSGGNATFLTVTGGPNRPQMTQGELIYRYVAAGGGGAGSAENGRNGRTFAVTGPTNGLQGQGPGGFGGTGFPTALGGAGNVNGGGGGGGYNGGNGGNSQTGQSGQGGASFATTSTAPAIFAQKSETQLPDGQARIFYTVVYDDIRFTEVSTTFDSDSLTDVGEPLVNGEVDTILFGQQFVNLTNNPQTVTYVLSTSTEAACEDGGTVQVVVTIAPEPTAFIADAGTDVTAQGDDYTATICSGDDIDVLIGTLLTPPADYNTAYVDVSRQLSTNTGFGTGANTIDGRINLTAGSPVSANQGGVFNNTGVNQTITYTIEPFIARSGQANCAGEPFTFTVTVQPGFPVNMTQPTIDVCSRDMLSEVSFDLDDSQDGFINVDFDEIRIEDLRISSGSADFTINGIDTTGLAAGGFVLNRTNNFFNDASFTNRTGSGVTVEFDVVFLSDDGCESDVVTYTFNVRAEPIINETTTAFTICEGDATGLVVTAAANSAFFNNFQPSDVTFSYTLDAGNLVETSGETYPVSGVGAFRANDDTFDNPTSMPQTATYTVVATSQFGCESQPVTYEVTVLPNPELTLSASQGDSTINGQALIANIETLTICSGTTVDFGISQDVTGTGVSYRIQRVVTGSVTNGDGSAIDDFEGGLPVANFQETLINTGTGSATVLYNIAVYTYGPDGIDGEGLNASDDCVGITQRVNIEVLPDATDDTALTNVLRVSNSNGGNDPAVNGAQICDNREIFIFPSTTVDPTTGAAFVWRRENEGPMLGGATSGSGNFQTSTNGNNVYPVVFNDLIRQVLTAEDDETREVRYIVTLYSFGTDGVNDSLAMGSDDCIGDIDTITVQLDPTPVLTADLEIGTAPVVSVNAEGSTYTYEICSGEDFLLDNLAFPETATGKLKYVDFQAIGQIEFLGLASGGFGTFQAVSPIGNFSLGAQNVQNTEPNGLAQTAFLFLTPYFEDGGDTADRDSEECAGETIQITVTINATPPNLGPFTETVCSEERVEYQIPGASNMGFRSRVAGTTTFDASDDFVVPPGAARIFNVDFTLSGANGGGSANNRGGLGGLVESSINPLFGFGGGNPTILYPGDTVRVRKGVAGASSPTNGGGGDATLLCIIAGPRDGFPAAPQGSIVETLLAGGGGGAGFAEAGADAGAEQVDPASDGTDGAGLGGFGGSGWNPMSPQSGSFGGAGRGNGGGGGGGWNGGDGGSNINGLAGGFGTSYAGLTGGGGGSIDADFSTKAFSAPADGTVTMEYILVYDDIRFDVVSRSVGAGLIDVSDNPIVSGEIDTILFGERFDNPTDAPIDVVYTFSTSSEANCPGGEVVVTLTVEPTPTLDLAGNGTMITDNNDGSYAAEICSGDSLSAVLSSMTVPSQGTNVVRARIIDVVTSSADVTFATGDGGEVSAPGNFGGNNQPSTADIAFYEAAINNVGDTNGTVTYTVVPFIINTVGSSGAQCVGDTLTLTVTVYPAFTGLDQGPIARSLCSNVSLDDDGFDVDATQPAVQIAYDSIIIDTVFATPAGDVNFDTIASVYNGSPVTVRRSEGFFGGDTYRNRTGGPVVVTYEVRFVSGPGCFSDPVTYNFTYRAEPVIDIVESLTNQIDTTICSGDMTGLTVNPAANSAFAATFQANITLEYSINLPAGVTLTKANGVYPSTGGRFYMRDDILMNNTNGPLDVVYTVLPSNGTCAGDAVDYTVTVNPNPFADVMLSSLASTETFGLDNSRLSVSPNPEFGICSGQAITATVPAASTSDAGMLMVDFQISTDDGGISGFPLGTNFTFPASELADSLSYAAGELMNTTADPQLFTVEYRAFIEANGTPGFQNDGVDCQSDGIIQFNVVVNPVNGAIVRTELNDTPGPIPAGMDTLCSGEVFDLFVRNLDAAGVEVDSFVVMTMDAGLDIVPGSGTPNGTFTIMGGPAASDAVRLQDFAYTNTTPGIKTITYTVTPYSGACAGMPATTTISYRAEINLVANESVLCADPGVSTSIFAIDANGGMLSNDRQEYRYAFIGGTASGYTLQGGNGAGNPVFVFDPNTQANNANLVFNNQSSVIVTPSPNSANFTPGTVNFQVIYDDSDTECQTPVTDTITINFQTTADPGTANQALGVLCDEVNFILNDALIGEDQGGVFTYTNGNPGLGVLNGANFTPMVGGSDPAPVSIDFTYTVGGGNSGCATASVDFTIMVEPAPNAGTYDGTVGEACEAAPNFNLFDLLDGEMQNGTFTQTAGVDFVTVNPDGTIDQDNITPGMYRFSYQVMSANGCGSDMVTGIMVQVNSREDCSDFVPCDMITLTAGFNVISFDVIPNDNAVRAIFASEIANRNLIRVIAVNPGVDNGNPEAFSYVSLIDDYVGNITGGIQGGYGYIVEVQNDATIEVCGTAVDPDLRVALQPNLNLVGYVPQTPEAVDSYFSQIIANGELNRVRTVVNGTVQNRVYGVFPFPVGPLTTMNNGLGYIVDVDAAYAAGSWRDADGITTTSNFDQFYGRIENGEELVGHTIAFIDDLGNVYGETVIREGGIYYNAFAFGDLESTEGVVEGFTPGADIYVLIDGERYATDAVFGGDWSAKQIDIELPGALTPTFEETAVKFAMNVYPNPTPGPVTVNLTFARSYDLVRVELFNVYGQLVLSSKLENVLTGRQVTEIDFTNLPAGAYQLRIMSEEGLLGNRQVIRQ